VVFVDIFRFFSKKPINKLVGFDNLCVFCFIYTMWKSLSDFNRLYKRSMALEWSLVQGLQGVLFPGPEVV
jgi:hypothetical protein